MAEEEALVTHIGSQPMWGKLLFRFKEYCQAFHDDDLDDAAAKQDVLSGKVDNLITELTSVIQKDESFYRLFCNFSASNMSLDWDEPKRIIHAELDKAVSAASQDQLRDKQTRLGLFARLLRGLCLPQVSSSHQLYSGPKPAQIEQHLARQFDRQFRGDAPIRFLEFVQKVRLHFRTADPKLYYKGSPIVQSSGTGKTRMVLELAKYAPLLFVCLRPDGSDAADGFPPSDAKVVTYFSDAANAVKEAPSKTAPRKAKYTCDLQVAAFLGAWFEKIAAELEKHKDPSKKNYVLIDMNRYAGSGQTATTIQETKERRDLFFNQVCQLARTKLKEAPTDDNSYKHQDTFKVCLDHGIKRLGKQLGEVRDYLWSHESTLEVHLLLEKIANDNGVADQHFDPRPPIFVAVDECVHLIKNVGQADHQLNGLRRAWNYINGRETVLHTPCFWLVLLSTNSAATILIEPRKSLGSARAQLAPLSPTFVNLGFDVIRQEAKPLRCAAQVADLDHVRSYGRPLWVSLRDEHFWHDAQMKLLGTADAYSKASQGKPAQVLTLHYNILASRLALHFVTVHEGSNANEQKALATGSVDRHMRILDKVIEDSRLSIKAHSEAVLAIAAGLVMLPVYEAQRDVDTYVKSRYKAIISGFRSQCIPVLDSAQKDVRGELLSRMVLAAAWDAAKLPALLHRAKQGEDLSSLAPIFYRPLSLRDLLDQLVKLDSVSAAVLDRRIESVCTLVKSTLYAADSPLPSKQSSKQSLKQSSGCLDEHDAADKNGTHPQRWSTEVKAWTNFTHFDLLPEGVRKISCDYLWYCWKRGVALQMQHNQHGVDGIIPVFVGDLERSFSMDGGGELPSDEAESRAARHMTFVAWEAKNRRTGITTSVKQALKICGPELLPASDIAPLNKETAISNKALTTRGLLTLLMEFGTDTKIQENSLHSQISRPNTMPTAPKQAGPDRGLKRSAGQEMVDDQKRKKAKNDVAGAEPSTSPLLPSYAGDGQQVSTIGSDSHPSTGIATHSGSEEDDDFVLATLRGIDKGDVYPCLDLLDVRHDLKSMVEAMQVETTFETNNRIVSPIYSEERHPETCGHIKERNDEAGV